MSILDSVTHSQGSRLARVTLLVFATALFASAALMFAIQPMFTRMVLPILGGSPGVWSVAMVFFQAMLLAGYLYAHLLARYLPLRTAWLVHLVVMALALLSLPIARATGFDNPPQSATAFWLVALFAASVGLPFFALAGNGPLLQSWFARSGHSAARDPYFLYGASNLGSFAGLLLYPVLIEPGFRLAEQSRLWTNGFVLLLGLIASAGLIVLRSGPASPTMAPVPGAAPMPPARIAQIVALAFGPSALLVAVTAQLSTDIAAAPMLWVLPLALFLLTFVLAFRDQPLLPPGWMLALQPPMVAVLVLMLVERAPFGMVGAVIVMLAGYFVCAMVAHGQLFLLRPPAHQLTGFYLWMSVGGVLGGIFAALLAPLMFNTILEYPVLLVAALLCRPAISDRWRVEAALVAGLALAFSAPALAGLAQLPEALVTARLLVTFVLAAAIACAGRDKGLLVGITSAALILLLAWQPGVGRTIAARSFFGVHRIVDTADGRLRLLYHGTTIHGAELLRDGEGALLTGRPAMLTYYYDGGPMSQAVGFARTASGELADVAVVGLGAGTLACAARPGEHWRFFEIDPEIIHIARDSGKFRFLAECAPGADIVAGDARLTLAADRQRYDLIILDAFSSDSIPVHLLTREAVQIYLAHLKPGGRLVMNITNRHMQLDDVVASVAASLGLDAYVGNDPTPLDFAQDFHAHALVATLMRPEPGAGVLAQAANWRKLHADPAVQPWSDDYSNLIGAIWRRWRQ